MVRRLSCVPLLLVAALAIGASGANAFDDARYPDWGGGWYRIGSGNWDPDKPRGLGQEAPLTPEYQTILEASIAAQDNGSQGNNAGYRCIPHGMPRLMLANEPIQFVIVPETTYVMLELFNQGRHIYTDGRGWPQRFTPASLGYSIGRWLDSKSDGRFDTLVVETRGLKGPRAYDNTGLPFHKDGGSIIRERIWLDEAKPDVLHNEITTIDHALTQPWTVTRSYRRERNPKWTEDICTDYNAHVVIHDEDYLLSWDGLLMPTRKDQPPPDLRHFDQPQP